MPKSTTVTISAADSAFLAERGARSHRGGGEFSRSVVLKRALVRLRQVLTEYDPRRSAGMSEPMHGLVVRLLPQPWALSRFELQHLDRVMTEVAGFGEAAQAVGLAPEAVIAAVAALAFVERVALADDATRVQAPEASQAWVGD
jgi:hypothetical protein